LTTKLNPKELLNAVKDLETQRPLKGLFKIVLASVLLVASSYFALSVPENISFFIAALFSGVIYAYALIPTHDAIHYTLTGKKWLDELYARIISYPIFWTHGTYAELHKLHHKMNGVEGRDPERKNPTSTEYFHKNLILRFYYRNRFLIDTFIFSGAGLIYGNIRDGLKFGKFSRSVKRALILDLSLLLMTHAGIIYILLPYNAVLKF
jgi:fatty acid desaturase